MRVSGRSSFLNRPKGKTRIGPTGPCGKSGTERRSKEETGELEIEGLSRKRSYASGSAGEGKQSGFKKTYYKIKGTWRILIGWSSEQQARD